MKIILLFVNYMSVLAEVGDKLRKEIPYSQMRTRKNEQRDELLVIRNPTHAPIFFVNETAVYIHATDLEHP